MRVWIVGKVTAETDAGIVWELQGVFAELQQAVMHARQHDYFVAPTFLNQLLPHESVPWPGAFWPKREAVPE